MVMNDNDLISAKKSDWTDVKDSFIVIKYLLIAVNIIVILGTMNSNNPVLNEYALLVFALPTLLKLVESQLFFTKWVFKNKIVSLYWKLLFGACEFLILVFIVMIILSLIPVLNAKFSLGIFEFLGKHIFVYLSIVAAFILELFLDFYSPKWV
ncbi:hypothetical protein [Lactiplantibacillus herbarum]|uniref:hypothetical protein n=1 Tax=Lactiplantibacillus herbarum TaxID=1670446 RepID=UPI00064F6CB2|nr:hypothetical protein [Lactiplantibacillus herbarum]